MHVPHPAPPPPSGTGGAGGAPGVEGGIVVGGGTVVGDVLGTVVGDVTGTVVGDVTGTVVGVGETASIALSTARKASSTLTCGAFNTMTVVPPVVVLFTVVTPLVVVASQLVHPSK
jgi:hypothetical protein